MVKELLHSKLRVLKLDSKLAKLKKLTGMVVQSLLFPKKNFSVSQAKNWASSHGYNSDKINVTENHIRFRQKTPGRFKDFKTIHFGDFVKAIVAGNMQSRFVGGLAMKGFSKFSDNVKSEMDLKIPLEVELRILNEGANRDGFISREDLEESLELWSKPAIIDFHDLEDMKHPTQHRISDRKGYLSNNPRLKLINGEYWVVNDAFITDRYLAYLIYLADKKGKPLEISAEYGWQPYWKDGVKHQTNLNPHLISIVDKGHIEGNRMAIKTTS